MSQSARPINHATDNTPRPRGTRDYPYLFVDGCGWE